MKNKRRNAVRIHKRSEALNGFNILARKWLDGTYKLE